jgi:GMP synthase (glutamine-hydrolysing)
MRKVLVFQHIANRLLGTLDPTLKERKLKIRYINYERTPNEHPTVDRYNGLIILGGQMGVYEADQYQHIKVELKVIEEALKKNIPVLGICLGAQLVAQVLGSPVRKHTVREIGWYDVQFNDCALSDSLFSHFNHNEKIFQIHGDTFDIPKSAIQLASTSTCHSQAFKYGDNVYGLQFHLEVDQDMINRWLTDEKNLKCILESDGLFTIDQIKHDTELYLARSLELSLQTFSHFVDLFPMKKRLTVLSSDHAMPSKKCKIQR